MRKKIEKWVKAETLQASKNGKYIFGISNQPFWSHTVFSVVSEEKDYLASYLAGNCSSVWPILISSPLI